MTEIDKGMVRRQISALGGMGLNELKAKFRALCGLEAGNTNAANLRGRLAYRIQEIYCGGLSESDCAILDDIADNDSLAKLETARRKKSRPAAVRYSRMWQGELHTCVEDGKGGFIYKGTLYRSLSAVANAITGAHWNGKLFFGVK